MYTIKTRNWNNKKPIAKMLNLITRYDLKYQTDFDIKFIYRTNSLLKGLLVLLYFKLLQPFSWGWTYIQKEWVPLDGSYKIFYI